MLRAMTVPLLQASQDSVAQIDGCSGPRINPGAVVSSKTTGISATRRTASIAATSQRLVSLTASVLRTADAVSAAR